MKQNDIDILFDVVEIEEAVEEICSLIEKFEDVHVALRISLGDDYATTYGNMM